MAMRFLFPFSVLLALSLPAAAQDMGGMAGALGPYAMTREASGTSWQPEAAPMEGIMLMPDDWTIMLEGRALAIADSQSGPRGDSLIFAPGMLMAMASRPLDDADTLGLRAMLSIDPFMGRRGFPLLLANGETADHYIERVADELKGKDCELYVATSDSLEQTIVLGRGAVRLSPRELAEDMAEERRRHREGQSQAVVGTNALMHRLDARLLEELERMRRGGGSEP